MRAEHVQADLDIRFAEEILCAYVGRQRTDMLIDMLIDIVIDMW